MPNTKPFLLLSDSQLFFGINGNSEPLLKRFITSQVPAAAACAYVGISNGDNPQFYEIFEEAMNLFGFTNCKMITSTFTKDEQDFLEKADLILLSGGDAERGLLVFGEKGITEILQRKVEKGTLLIGVSAGAIQLGWQNFEKTEDKQIRSTEALKFIPFVVLVHRGEKNLEEVEAFLEADTMKRAYAIPYGAGLIYHPDQTVEAIRKPISEFILKDDVLKHTLIFPPNE